LICEAGGAGGREALPTRASTSGGMPWPLSATSSSTQFSDNSTVWMARVPPSGIAFTAFTQRFISAPEMAARIAEAEAKARAAGSERLQAEAQLGAAQSTLESLQQAARATGKGEGK